MPIEQLAIWHRQFVKTSSQVRSICGTALNHKQGFQVGGILLLSGWFPMGNGCKRKPALSGSSPAPLTLPPFT
ncbi:MAG: hypothetical protein ACOY3V_00015 [Pseudomonadota bacterium]